jgi:hypothetical protein
LHEALAGNSKVLSHFVSSLFISTCWVYPSWPAPIDLLIYIAASTPPILHHSILFLVLTTYYPPFPMLATASIHDPTMRDLEQELRDTLDRLRDSNGDPLDGLHVLTRQMHNQEDEQFDVDLTILDFLLYKATGIVFEWRASADPFHSDLPSALVTMTGGMHDSKTGPNGRIISLVLKLHQNGGPFSPTDIMDGG